MRQVRLGAVFVNYRRPDLLFSALRSMETTHRVKVIVIDKAYLNLPSLAAAWNRGIEAAIAWGADWVLVSSDDVIFHPCTVDHLVERASEKGYGLLCPCDVHAHLGLGPADLAAMPEPQTGEDQQAADYAAFLISPELFREVGPFDERFAPAYYEDSDYNLRLGQAGRPAMMTSYAPFYHYCGASGGVSTEVGNRNRAYFIAKWQAIVPWVAHMAPPRIPPVGPPNASG